MGSYPKLALNLLLSRGRLTDIPLPPPRCRHYRYVLALKVCATVTCMYLPPCSSYVLQRFCARQASTLPVDLRLQPTYRNIKQWKTAADCLLSPPFSRLSSLPGNHKTCFFFLKEVCPALSASFGCLNWQASREEDSNQTPTGAHRQLLRGSPCSYRTLCSPAGTATSPPLAHGDTPVPFLNVLLSHD